MWPAVKQEKSDMRQTARSKQQGRVHQWVCHAIQLPAPRGSLYPKYASAGCPSVTWCQGSSQGFLQGRQGREPRSPHSSNAARATPRCSPRPALSGRQTGWQKGWQHRKIRESLSTRMAESVTAGTLCGPAPEPHMLTKHALLHLHEAAWFTVGLT